MFFSLVVRGVLPPPPLPLSVPTTKKTFFFCVSSLTYPEKTFLKHSEEAFCKTWLPVDCLKVKKGQKVCNQEGDWIILWITYIYFHLNRISSVILCSRLYFMFYEKNGSTVLYRNTACFPCYTQRSYSLWCYT